MHFESTFKSQKELFNFKSLAFTGQIRKTHSISLKPAARPGQLFNFINGQTFSTCLSSNSNSMLCAYTHSLPPIKADTSENSFLHWFDVWTQQFWIQKRCPCRYRAKHWSVQSKTLRLICLKFYIFYNSKLFVSWITSNLTCSGH